MNFWKKLKSKKWWIAIGIILILLIVRGSSKGKDETVYEVSEVSRGDLLETIATTGSVKADEYANLTFQSGGRLAFVNVKNGDEVKKGAAIAGLDTVILNAGYQQALNNYRNYQAVAENVIDGLKDNDSIETFSEKATRTTAEVNRDNAYDAVKSAQRALSFATIYAPFSGIVAQATPSFAGANVTTTNSSYVLVNPQTTYFESEIEESDLPKVKLGQKVKIRLDAYPDEEIDGEIENIGIVAFTSSTGGNAYSLRIKLPENTDFKYKVGMEGDVDIILNTISNVVKVPSSGLVIEDGLDYVWVFENKKVKKVEVKVGADSGDEVEILEGLDEGDVVVLDPSNKFKDGLKITTG